MPSSNELKIVAENCHDYGYHGFISAKDLETGRSCETCHNWSNSLCQIDVYDGVVSSLADKGSLS